MSDTDYDSLEVQKPKLKRQAGYGKRINKLQRRQTAAVLSGSSTKPNQSTSTGSSTAALRQSNSNSHKQLKRINSAVELGKRARSDEESEDGDAESASDEHDLSPKKLLANKRARATAAPAPAPPPSHAPSAPTESLQSLSLPKNAPALSETAVGINPGSSSPKTAFGKPRRRRGTAGGEGSRVKGLSEPAPKDQHASEDSERGKKKRSKTHHPVVSEAPAIFLAGPADVEDGTRPYTAVKMTLTGQENAVESGRKSPVSRIPTLSRRPPPSRAPTVDSRRSVPSSPNPNFVLGDKSNLPRGLQPVRASSTTQAARTHSATAPPLNTLASPARRHASATASGSRNVYGNRRSIGASGGSPRIRVLPDEDLSATLGRSSGTGRIDQNEAPATVMNLANLEGALPTVTDAPPSRTLNDGVQPLSFSPLLVPRRALSLQSQSQSQAHPQPQSQQLQRHFSHQPTQSTSPPGVRRRIASPNPNNHETFSRAAAAAATSHDLDVSDEELALVYQPPNPRAGSLIPHTTIEMNSSFVLETYESPTSQLHDDPGDPFAMESNMGGGDEIQVEENPQAEVDKIELGDLGGENEGDRFRDVESYNSFGGPKAFAAVHETSSSPRATSPSPPSARYQSAQLPRSKPDLADSDDSDVHVQQSSESDDLDWLPPRIRHPVMVAGRPKRGEDDLAWAIRTQSTGEEEGWEFTEMEKEVGDAFGPGRTLWKGYPVSKERRMAIKRQLLENPPELNEDTSDDALMM